MLSIGLVGLPNAGKSSLFNLLTSNSVPAENFPFCTIEPSDGVVAVSDSRLTELSKITQSNKIVPAMIEFRDIAGLVKNASSGAGLGNQFLSHIREVDLILLVIRCFEDDNIIHVENRVNPQEDEEILLMELAIHDQNILTKQQTALLKFKGKDSLFESKNKAIEELLKRCNGQNNTIAELDQQLAKELEYTKWRKSLNLLTDKPIVRLANISQEGKNADYQYDFSLDVKLETELNEMTTEERLDFGYDAETGLDKLIRHCFYKLNLATYLTTGQVETKAWTFKKGMLAPQCAGIIHTDFAKKFIKAEVINYEDFTKLGGRKNCIENGKMRMEGKEYVMQDGDVVEFKIGG
jgi:GTP-binding protein YchF